MAARGGKTKAQRVAEEVARVVNAGKSVTLETVDFSDPDRPKTCLEVDFPIIPINQIATIEGNAMKPVYQMGKWWAWRRSSVFRALLLAAATKAPDDEAEAAKAIWSVYYGNHQCNKAFSKLRVTDIFMGGGTTLVEGARLGMSMHGADLNPVAWLVVKNRVSRVASETLEELLEKIETRVKPELMPFFQCECPRGHSSRWYRADGKELPAEFDPLTVPPDKRMNYRYEGPEILHTFWAKHGPCIITGCNHRTPLLSANAFAEKTISVKAWRHSCKACDAEYDIEDQDARMAPTVPLTVSPSERPYAVLHPKKGVICPSCGHHELFPSLQGKGKRKSVSLSLLIHPSWTIGESAQDAGGNALGGSVGDNTEDTLRWHSTRAAKLRLLEVRGSLPDEVTCPETNVSFPTGTAGGTIPKGGHFTCGACGSVQSNVEAVGATQKTAPVAAFAFQGYCARCDKENQPYGGRFFVPATNTATVDGAFREWERRKDADLAGFWPTSEIPFGHMTHQRQPLPQHGYRAWADMFNSRQLLVHAVLLRAINHYLRIDHPAAEYLLSGFQQYLRNQNMFCFWHRSRDHFAPALSNANFHPKDGGVEVGAFCPVGYGPWPSTVRGLVDAARWLVSPWELVSNERLSASMPTLAESLTGKSEKVYPGDHVLSGAVTECCSASDLNGLDAQSQDLIITDPPFGGNLHYSELSDFFYVWLRLVLKERYPHIFKSAYSPKTLEAVANKARQPDDSDAFYARILTECWREAHRILKPAGILAFTFHHSEDAPWVAVLESLFDAGFYLEATYPIRSDETKGQGEFGSKKIEYDIVHVCRKRTDDQRPVSWARMRRQVLSDVNQLKSILEHHQGEGLPEADLQVIRRGKALEYYSRHYGQVFINEGKQLSVQDALLGINQLLDEELGVVIDPPPANAEPFTRQFLRLFDGQTEVPRDQMQKSLRGTGISPGDFEERGWCRSEKKIYHLVPPVEIAQGWAGRHRRGMSSDYDQAAFLIGACFDNSGINATDTLGNNNFKPHPALGALLDWFSSRGATTEIRNASIRARSILRGWKSKNQQQAQQMSLFFEEGVTS